MRRTDLEQKLDTLHEAAERVCANLVELEIDSGRQLLEASTLTGESASRWAGAGAALTELWRRHGLLTSLLERADKLRGPRRAGELESLLSGPAIELASSRVPLAERQLLGSPESAERCSAEQLLAGMSSLFDEVKAVMAEISGVWEELGPKLDDARGRLYESTRLAEELGEADRRDLEVALERQRALSAAVSGDPLSITVDEVDGLARDARAIRDGLEADAGLRRAFEARILNARELLEQLKDAIAGAKGAYEELLLKISAPAGGQQPDGYESLERGLDEIVEYASQGQWRHVRESLERWSAGAQSKLADTRHVLEANRAPITARNQLRALLEAYRVKAGRLGAIEHPILEAIHAQARESLYTAPTDLANAAQLVRSYQQTLTELHPSSEALV